MTPRKRGRKTGAKKTGGRKKGTPNKVTLPLRDFITIFLTENQHKISADFKKLTPYQRIQIFERLAKYSLPTLQSIDANINVDKLNDDQLGVLINQIKQTLK
ncbi:hypothetical protein DC498_17650 [Terrimonas sp.]|uniref:hypothetical protein n=1 Tax=Terrimonas sp. TaxID=1914338 RepID=UPI000D523FE1|nr:hypothetical protein [Terrimonas sp.]PVD50797.1 hypothetical protein DC498_17650 [Terrimonas sp.]